MNAGSVIETIRGNRELYAPLSVTLENVAGNRVTSYKTPRLNLRIAGKTLSFEAVLIISGSLRDIELGILRALKTKTEKGVNQILVVPFLSKTVQTLLEEEGVSAIDLSGNYFIILPELTAIRLDRKNGYKVKRVIQNIYSRNSSIAVRWLLTKKTVENNLLLMKSEMDKAGSGLSLGTISKVLKVLEEDVFIFRTPEKITVLKPDKLLARLKDEYRKPPVLSELRIQLPDRRSEAAKILSESLGINDWIWSGETSSDAYASTVQESRVTIYTKNNPVTTGLARLSDDRFYNSIVQYISDPLVFFGAADNLASAIQSYIELARSDKRNKEISEDIRRVILH
ncbi:MAG: replication/maintenance protein RepL [Ignavibacteriaceae bacterium]|nr:replication/maintenance protein RepL [Ignavibacteriaceae bacterium]